MSFDQLGLSAELLKAINQKGYSNATPIQKKAIPIILSGDDLLAGAPTGTGKTASFTLPLLEKLKNGRQKGKEIRALILVPTRELASQVADNVHNYANYLPLKVAKIYGGVSIGPQKAKLRKGVDIVVATPGRLLDHMMQRSISLTGVETIVLDEADRMLDMGFIKDIRKILAKVPKKRQTLLFSATFSAPIKELANDFLNSQKEVQIAGKNKFVDKVKQVVYLTDRGQKNKLLLALIMSESWNQVLVFVRTKHGADRLTKYLLSEGIRTLAIHSNKSQLVRSRSLDDFKSGKAQVLVATEVASRGLDIEKLPYVVNYDLPDQPDDYIHRIGRTARAGKDGIAVSLVGSDEGKLLYSIERFINIEINKVVLEGFEPTRNLKIREFKKSASSKPKRKRSRGPFSDDQSASSKPKRKRSSKKKYIK